MAADFLFLPCHQTWRLTENPLGQLFHVFMDLWFVRLFFFPVKFIFYIIDCCYPYIQGEVFKSSDLIRSKLTQFTKWKASHSTLQVTVHNMLDDTTYLQSVKLQSSSLIMLHAKRGKTEKQISVKSGTESGEWYTRVEFICCECAVW